MVTQGYQQRPRLLRDVAAALGAPVVGDPDLPIGDIVHPRMARSATDLVLLMEPALVDTIAGTMARAAIVAEGITVPDGVLAGYVSVTRPRWALAIVLELFARPPHAPPGIHPSAVVDATAEIAEGVSIGALSYVGPGARVGAGSIVMPQVTIGAEARIGAGCLLHPGTRIGERVVLGNRVIVHHNASIGADGFAYATPQKASFEEARGGGDTVEAQISGLRRIASLGTVIVGDDVEVGACATIDRANLGATTIGRGTKIDNLVQVGHNASIGEDCLFSGQVGISGSVRVGNRVVMAGQAGIADHARIGDDAIIGPQSGVSGKVGERQVVLGSPAMPKSAFFGERLNLGRIGRILRELADMKARLARLEQGDKSGDDQR